MSVPARRRQVAYGRERGRSARRACTLFSVARSALSYQSRKAAKDAPVVERMKQLSAQYPRYGYRRIRIFLGRDGYRMSPGRAHRLWRAAGLQVPRKRPKKRVVAARPRPQTPCGPNQVWSYDFVFDHCANGKQLKCLTVTDEFTKEGLAIDVDGRIRSTRVIEVLSRLVRCVRIRASTISRRTSSWRKISAPSGNGTLRYMEPPRPGPLRNRPVGDKCSQRGKPSQANRGPKNPGRPRPHVPQANRSQASEQVNGPAPSHHYPGA